MSSEKQSRKKKVYYVPSRYLQAAEQVSSRAGSSRDSTALFRTTINQRSQGLESSSDSASSTKLNVTHLGRRGMTSTPTSTAKTDLKLPGLDESAVSTLRVPTGAPHFKESIGPLPSDSLKINLKRNKLQNEAHGPVVAFHREVKVGDKFNQRLADAQVDIMYAKYIQAVYLDHMTKKTLEKRSENAIKKIHQLLNLVLFYLEKYQPVKSKAEMASVLLKLLRHFKKQAEIYQPFFDVLPALEIHYQNLAEAVNVTKHKLQVKGVPVPESGSEDEIIHLLEETDSILSDFFSNLKNVDEIIKSADGMEEYIALAETISEVLQKSAKTLAEAQDLLLSEASLQLSQVHL